MPCPSGADPGSARLSERRECSQRSAGVEKGMLQLAVAQATGHRPQAGVDTLTLGTSGRGAMVELATASTGRPL